MDPAASIKMSALRRQEGLHEASAQNDSDIQRFYCNSTVFLTGGSGFLGKQLIEKLLRSCKIRRLYLLLRARKGKSLQERFLGMLEDPVFEMLRTGYPEFADRIVPMQGDVSLLRLGLSDDDLNTISEKVTIIIHAAATVRFDDTLKRAVETNVRGTREVLTLAKTCRKLQSMVHVSTAYAHATADRIGKEVRDVFFMTPIEPETLIQMVDSMDPRKIEDITPGLIKGWPNTYTFTKAVAEEMVRVAGEVLPICIIRPTIVVEAYTEPTPGWIEESCVYGASGITLGSTMGIIHVVYSKMEIKIDFVPVDYVNNAILAAGWETGKRRFNGQKGSKVYNITSDRNAITWGFLSKTLMKIVSTLVTPKAKWLCVCLQSSNYHIHLLYTVVLHYIPAYIIDGISMLFGKRTGLVELYKKIYKSSVVMSYFTTNDWNFIDQNSVDLQQHMSETDRKIFNFDITDINRAELIILWTLGIREYIIKDGLVNTKYGVKKQNIFKLITYVFIIFVTIIVFWWLKVVYRSHNSV